jgi:uncharacterized membrane protein YgaE (UPF0421/DUF939 family)
MSIYVKLLLGIVLGCLIAQFSFAISGQKSDSNLFFVLAMVFIAAAITLLGVEKAIGNKN